MSKGRVTKTITSVVPRQWASNHMTGEEGKFKTLDKSVTGQVKFGDGFVVYIRGKGDILFKCKNGEDRVFTDVFFIPDLCNNIISLGQLSEGGNKIVMDGEYMWVYAQSGRTLMKVKKSENRLYKISLEDNGPMCLMVKTEQETWLWHNRLGHVNIQALELMSREKMARGIPKLVQPTRRCEGCLMSKQPRSPFPSSTTFKVEKKLELVYAHLCGPITPTTPGGNRYFLLFVDDFSRRMLVYLLKEKSSAFDAFKKFKSLVENRSELKIKMLRTDRGGEFCSKEFNSFYEDSGIERQYTAPYTPQQNEVVERRNRTVAAMVRSFIKES